MAYTLGNKCAKILCKRVVLLQLIIENVVTFFFGTQCSSRFRAILLETKLQTHAPKNNSSPLSPDEEQQVKVI